MILERLKVTNWRNLRKPVELKGFSEGINIIHAPNGTGKSSLFEALRSGIFDAHHTEKIKAVQPWGCSLPAEVEVDFVHNGIHYRIEKRFLKRKFSCLWKKEKGVFQPLVDGRQADEKVREILKASNGVGAAKPEHWGLYQALWAPQGKLALGSLSPDLTANLQDALSNQLIGEKGNLLEKLLKERYQEFFTNKKGEVKKGKDAPPIVALEEKRDQLQKECDTLREEYRTLQDEQQRFQEAKTNHEQTQLEVGKLHKEVEQTRRESDKYKQLAGELQQHQSEEKAARAEHEKLSDKIERIQSTRKNIEELEEKIVATNEHIRQLNEELETARQKEAEAQEKYNQAKKAARKELDNLDERKDAARDFLDARKSSEELTERLEKLSNEQIHLADLKKQRNSLVAPDDQRVKEVRKAIASRNEAKVALQASLIHLTIEPLEDARVRDRNKNDLQSISGGESETFSGSPEVAVEVEGFGSIRAAGPEGDAEKHRQTLDKSEKKINELTHLYSTQDPDQLQNLLEQAKDLDNQIKQSKERIHELLDEETDEELRQQHETLKDSMGKCLKKYQEWRKKSPVPSEMQTEYETLQHQIEDAVNSIEEELTTAQEDRQTVENRLTEFQADLRNHSENLKMEKERLKTDLQDQTIKQLEEKKHEFLMTWDAAKTKVANCKKKLSGLSEEAVHSLPKLENQLAEKEKTEKAKSAEENQAKGMLEALAGEGVYSRLTNCKERLAETKEGVRREQLQMGATRLLHDVARNCKEEMLADLSRPVEKKATEMRKQIAGDRLWQPCFSENLELRGVQPQALEETVDCDNLSGGEQEQLFLIVRLALAQVLAGKERQLVVLDDVLHASDGQRIKRFCKLLEKEAEEKLQIVLLTCHPERYADWKGNGVRFFDLFKMIGEL